MADKAWHGESFEDDTCSGRVITVVTPEIVTEVYSIVMGDRQITETFIASALGISQERVHFILTDELNIKKQTSARWVPRVLIVYQKHTNLLRTDPDKFMLTMDETGIHYFTQESKQESKQWNYLGSPPQKKAKTSCQLGRLSPRIFGC